MAIVSLVETEPGLFEGSSKAITQGVYHARFLAKGVTLRGVPFSREQIGTAAVWAGGDDPYHHPDSDPDKDDCCRLLSCLVDEKSISRELDQRLRKAGVNLDHVRRCIRGPHHGRPGKKS